MLTLVITLIIIDAILLVLVVLAQNPKGSGLSAQFGGSGATQLMGVKRTTDIMEKITWGLAIFLVILSLSTDFFIDEPGQQGISSPNVDRAQERTVMPGVQPGLEDLLDNSSSDSSQTE